MAGDAVAVDDVLDYLNMDTATMDDQAELEQYISAAVEVVEMYCGPILVRAVTDYDHCGDRSVLLEKTPAVELVSITSVDGAGHDVTGYRVVRESGLLRPAGAGRMPHGLFDVAYRAGWAETVTDVPPALALACQVIVAHLYGDQRRPTLGPQPDYGDPYPQTPPGSGFAIPYKARDLMAPFRMVLMP